MPTAAKIAAALLFAALAWIASRLTFPLWPEGSSPGRFAEVNAALGLVLGWRMAGARAGQGAAAAIGTGLTTAVTVAVLALFVHGFVLMMGDALRRRFDGPVEALVAVFGHLVEQARLLASAPVIATILGGGILAGLVTEWFGRNFR